MTHISTHSTRRPSTLSSCYKHTHITALLPTHTHTGDMVSASDNSSRAANLLLLPSRWRVGQRQQQGQLSLSQSLASLCLCKKLSSPFLHEITPLLLWDYLLSGAKQQLKTMQIETTFAGKLIWKMESWPGPVWQLTIQLFVPFHSCRFYFPGKSQLEKK